MREGGGGRGWDDSQDEARVRKGNKREGEGRSGRKRI